MIKQFRLQAEADLVGALLTGHLSVGGVWGVEIMSIPGTGMAGGRGYVRSGGATYGVAGLRTEWRLNWRTASGGVDPKHHGPRTRGHPHSLLCTRQGPAR